MIGVGIQQVPTACRRLLVFTPLKSLDGLEKLLAHGARMLADVPERSQRRPGSDMSLLGGASVVETWQAGPDAAASIRPMSRIKIIMLSTVSVLALSVASLALYARFEYTLVADLREGLASEPADTQALGQLLFTTRGCAGCHQLSSVGSDARIGPTLDGIGARVDLDYLRSSITDPSAVIAPCEQGPCAFEMPEFGSILTDEQIDALVAYLAKQ